MREGKKIKKKKNQERRRAACRKSRKLRSGRVQEKEKSGPSGIMNSHHRKGNRTCQGWRTQNKDALPDCLPDQECRKKNGPISKMASRRRAGAWLLERSEGVGGHKFQELESRMSIVDQKNVFVDECNTKISGEREVGLVRDRFKRGGKKLWEKKKECLESGESGGLLQRSSLGGDGQQPL